MNLIGDSRVFIVTHPPGPSFLSLVRYKQHLSSHTIASNPLQKNKDKKNKTKSHLLLSLRKPSVRMWILFIKHTLEILKVENQNNGKNFRGKRRFNIMV